MSWFLTNLVAIFLLPPLNLLLVATLGITLWYRRPLLARRLVISSLGLLWLASTPYVAQAALHLLEEEQVALNPAAQAADAIVVLGGGTYFNAPEYGGDTVSGSTLLRLRYAAKLQRETGKPVLTSGGSPLGNTVSEARQMKDVLEKEFNVPVQWTEDASANTFENARLSFQKLKPLGIQRIYLVTQAWHMPRAVRAFQSAGFEVVAAPTAFSTHYRVSLLDFLPSADALHDSSIFLHEAIGLVWYRLKSSH